MKSNTKLYLGIFGIAALALSAYSLKSIESQNINGLNSDEKIIAVELYEPSSHATDISNPAIFVTENEIEEDDVAVGMYTDLELLSFLIEMDSDNNFASKYRALLPHIVAANDLNIKSSFYDMMLGHAMLSKNTNSQSDFFEDIEIALGSEVNSSAFISLLMGYQSLINDESRHEMTDTFIKNSLANLSEPQVARVRVNTISNGMSSNQLDSVIDGLVNLDVIDQGPLVNPTLTRVYYWANQNPGETANSLQVASYINSVNPLNIRVHSDDSSSIDPVTWLRARDMAQGTVGIESSERNILQIAETSDFPNVVLSILESVRYECEYVELPFSEVKCNWYRNNPAILSKLSVWLMSDDDITSSYHQRIEEMYTYFNEDSIG